ncbi:unnamed protein product, partial [Laminaria digitata]
MSPADRTFSRTDQVVPVLEQHRFDTAPLVAWMETNIEGFAGPIEIAQFQGGMSNPTFLLTDANQCRYVLRKKPPGELLPSAHAVDREHRITSALGPTPVPVVRTLALCEDTSIVGTEFFLMDHANGRVFHDPSLPESTPKERSAVYASMIETLAALHQVDFEKVGLSDYG